jgi:hypothetical protein
MANAVNGEFTAFLFGHDLIDDIWQMAILSLLVKLTNSKS